MKRWLAGAGAGFGIAVLLFCGSASGFAEIPAGAEAAFQEYAARVESRLAQQHGSKTSFIADAVPGSATDARLRRGEFILEKLSPADEAQPKGALLHDWRGTAFVRGVTAGSFEHLMKDFGAYPQVFEPQVTRARVLSPQTQPVPDHFTAMMRVRQKHVITVVMDTTYDVTWGRLDRQHGYSASHSTKISEIADPDTPKERALAANKDHGFLWHLNTYWSYEERDGGLYIQIESISLTRGIPTGLGWMIGPYVQSVPRESLDFTLRSTSKALQK